MTFFLRPLGSLPHKICIIPHQGSHDIPWNFLVKELSPYPKYLIEDHIILKNPSIKCTYYLHSAQKTREEERAKKSTSPFIIANPTMPKGLDPLPGSSREGEEVSRLLGKENCCLLTGDHATKDVVRNLMKGASFIHAATHCIMKELLSQFSYMDSSLAISSDTITAAEVQDLECVLASTIVLSACRTGDGKVTEEGVLDFSRACISQGVRNIAVSIYRIPDEFTATLMRKVYQHYVLLDSFPLALQKGIAELLADLRSVQSIDPLAFGGFICTGLDN